MSDTQHTGIGALTRAVERHDKDLYYGNGKPGLTSRVNTLEEWQERTDMQLNGSYGKPGLADQIQNFFAIQEDKDKADKRREKSYLILIAILAIGVPILYDVVKHQLGWH